MENASNGVGRAQLAVRERRYAPQAGRIRANKMSLHCETGETHFFALIHPAVRRPKAGDSRTATRIRVIRVICG